MRTASRFDDDADLYDDPEDLEFEARHRSFVQHAVKFGRVALLLIVIWALGGFHDFWPVWPIAVFGFLLARRAMSLSTPRGDYQSAPVTRKRHGCCGW